MANVPLFIVNGLLESGKTTLIKEVVENNVSYQEYNTLLIVCEEGEVEYEQWWLEEYKVHIHYVDSIEELSIEKLTALDEKCMPAQIVLELNGFYDLDEIDFPSYMQVYQIITTIDTTTFGVYFPNMKPVFNNLVKYSSLVIFNRSDDNPNLGSYRRQIKMFNPECQVAFEGMDGSLTGMLDEDLPYDITKDEIYFEEEDYPTWYIDVFDHHDKYMGKTIKFKTFIKDVIENGYVIGRDVMTCCEDDIQFFGYELIDETESICAIGDAVLLECEVVFEYSDIAGEEVVMLKAKKIHKLPKEENKVLGM